MSKVLIYGNGESRKNWDITKSYKGFKTWGCNAIYRDCTVDTLVGIDYGIQQEIYKSGYANRNECRFTDWSILENFDVEFMKMSYAPEFIFETSRRNKGSGYGWYDRTKCVVQGKDFESAERNYNEMVREFPNLDKEDLKTKCYNNVGLYITWLEDEDKVQNIEYPREWCAGATAIHLACQEGADEIYMLGFDLSSYDEPLNNIYKGTDNYLPTESKGFNPINWIKQLNTVFNEFSDTKFYWGENRDVRVPKILKKNVENISYKTLDKICKT